MNEHRIVLIRHGRSAHVQSGWIDRQGFNRWREAYDEAGILSSEIPSQELLDMTADAGIVVASDTPRAIETAQRLFPERVVTTSPLLREFELSPPPLGRLRLPFAGWAIAYSVRWIYRAARRRAQNSSDEIARTDHAAEWLSTLAAKHGSVVAVTHGSFRMALAKALVLRGWKHAPGRRTSRNWSAWTMTRP